MSERRLLADTTRRVLADHRGPRAARAVREPLPRALWSALEELGFTRTIVPEPDGEGVALADALAVVAVAAEEAAALPLAETLLAAWTLGEAGLPVPHGVLTVAAGPDAAVDGARVAGTVARVPWAEDAAAVVLVARSGDVAVLERGEWRATAGRNLAGEPRDGIAFDVALPAGRLGAIADPRRVGALGALLRAVQLAASMQRVLELSVTQARDRAQFGRPIGGFQAVQRLLAELAGEALAAAAAVDAAVAGWERSPIRIAIAKARASEAAGRVAALAHQIHGAIGLSSEHELGLHTARLWSWRDELGSERDWAEQVGAHVLECAEEDPWAVLSAL